MSNEIVEKLRAAKADLQGRLRTLMQDVEVTKRDLEAIDRIIDRYAGHQISLPIGSKDSGKSIYYGMGLKDAILKLLDQKYPKDVKVKQISKTLKVGGIESDAKNFDAAVSATLSILVKEGRAVRTAPGQYKGVEPR